ncbi:hypothetical protein BX600DRAFT_507748 [Xylariales sp. PMI_506]|nr:hypothetical protein BX600DRAFT_507748 [Xylariales sp. PMI_506]
MSLARAFTTRRMKQSVDLTDAAMPQRSNTTARKGLAYAGSIRNKISAPMELTHTTNMLAYNAPDLHPRKQSSATSSRASDDESDALSSASSPPTSPDVASIDGRSGSPELEPNHLSCYFTPPGHKLPAHITEPVPKIPQRSPSHTKKASLENMARMQSLRQSSMSAKSTSTKSSSLSRSSSTSTTATSVSSNSYIRSKPEMPSVPAVPSIPAVAAPTLQNTQSAPAAPLAPRQQTSAKLENSVREHPFGKELAQVTEIAEDYGVKDKMRMLDDEEQELVRKGLCRFRADDYLSEIQALFTTFFTPEPVQSQPVWI